MASQFPEIDTRNIYKIAVGKPKEKKSTVYQFVAGPDFRTCSSEQNAQCT
jgi:hypothetical protein